MRILGSLAISVLLAGCGRPVGPGSDLSPAGGDQASCAVSWSCSGPEGSEACQSTAGGALPAGGHRWTCHKVAQYEANPGESSWDCGETYWWICNGQIEPGDPPPTGGCGWTCSVFRGGPSGLVHQCRRVDGPDDIPPGGTNESALAARKCRRPDQPPPPPRFYACLKGSDFAGTRCWRTATPPASNAAACSPGQKRWCEEPGSRRWGQATCTAAGRWPMTGGGMEPELDCRPVAYGRVPDNDCACYHPFFNRGCCERVDCILPPSGSGRVCPSKSGQGLCDPCTPGASPSCRCVSGEELRLAWEPGLPALDRSCSTSEPGLDLCPPGYRCDDQLPGVDDGNGGGPRRCEGDLQANPKEAFCVLPTGGKPCPEGTSARLLGPSLEAFCVPHDSSCYY